MLYIPWRHEDEFKKSDETYKQIFDRYSPLMPILKENIVIRKKVEKAQELARQILYEATLPEVTVSEENETTANENDNSEFYNDYSVENAFQQSIIIYPNQISLKILGVIRKVSNMMLVC